MGILAGKIPLLLAGLRSLAEKGPEWIGSHGPEVAGGAAAAAGTTALLVPVVAAAPILIEHLAKKYENSPRPEALIDLYRESLLRAIEKCAEPLRHDSNLTEEDRSTLELWEEGLRVSAKGDPHWGTMLQETIPQDAIEALVVNPGDEASFWPLIRLHSNAGRTGSVFPRRPGRGRWRSTFATRSCGFPLRWNRI